MKILLILITIICFGISTNAQLGARITNSISSICPPLNWKNSFNVVFNGPVEQGENVNSKIQTKIEISGGSRTVKNLKEYVDIEVGLLGSRVVSRSSFKTNSDIVGEKVIFKTKDGFDPYSNPLLKIQYFFYRGEKEYNNCVIITCTVLESKASKYFLLFDESVKTFKHIKK